MFHNEGNNRHIRAWQRARQKERADDKGRMFQQLRRRLTESILKVRGRENEIHIVRSWEKNQQLSGILYHKPPRGLIAEIRKVSNSISDLKQPLNGSDIESGGAKCTCSPSSAAAPAGADVNTL